MVDQPEYQNKGRIRSIENDNDKNPQIFRMEVREGNPRTSAFHRFQFELNNVDKEGESKESSQHHQAKSVTSSEESNEDESKNSYLKTRDQANWE
jgi:hypothetical protein